MGTTWKDNMFQWKNIMKKNDQNKISIAIQCKITVT